MEIRQSPIERAVEALLELAREFMPADAVHVYALAWLAAARLITAGREPQTNNIGDLMSDAAWDQLGDLGLSLSDTALSIPKRDDSDREIARRTQAVAIVAQLAQQLKGARWDILPCLELLAGRNRDGGQTFVPGDLEEMLLALAGDSAQGMLWIPFDPMGSMSIRAARRGWRLADVYLGDDQSAVTRRLMMTIEHGQPPTFVPVSEPLGHDTLSPGMRADVVIVNPPFGAKPSPTRLTESWLSMTTTRQDVASRSEVWAVQEFVNRASKRAVFLIPANLLFARGQEERLREYLLNRGGECTELEAVIALPSTHGASAMPASAVLVLSPGGHHDATRMVDLGGAKRASGSFKEIEQRLVDVALGRQVDERRCILVRRDQIEMNETSFAPSRYLRSLVDVGPHSATLGELCELIRPPSLSKVSTGTRAVEVGIAHLGLWRPIQPDGSKVITTRARPGELPALRTGDIILAIKGSVGKVGLVGATKAGLSAVVSQSCVALRLDSAAARKNRVSSSYLLMYLASEQGQAQLKGLQVGMGVPHISPATLLSATRVPLPGDEADAVDADHEALCSIELEIERLAKKAQAIQTKRWTMPDDERATQGSAPQIEDEE